MATSSAATTTTTTTTTAVLGMNVVSPHPPAQHQLPRFVHEPTVDGPVRPGYPVTLTCSCEPQRNATIHWLFNGQRISPSALRRRGVEAAGGHLRIPGFNPQTHEGFYQCSAENQFAAVLSSEVKVEAAVLLPSNPGRSGGHVVRMEALIGSTVHINCPKVLSRPQAIYDVTINDTKLQLTARHRLLPSGILQVTAVTASDQGAYRCLALNSVLGAKMFVDNTTFLLKVVSGADHHVQRSNLSITVANKNLTGTSRQNLTLECAASGWSHVDIHWEKYGGHLPSSKTFQDSGYLLIANAQKSDEGTYECTATALVSGKEVLVREAASVTILEPPTAEISPDQQTVVEGSTVTLKCKSSGSPRISYKWFFNGVQVSSEQFVTIRDSSLTMSNVNRKRSGAYQCFASNAIGSAYGVTRLVVTRSRSEGSYGDDDDDDDDAVYEAEWDSKSESPRPTRGDVTITKPTASLEADLGVRLSWLVQPRDQPISSGGYSFKVQMKNLEGGHGWETMRDNLPFGTRSYIVQRDSLQPGKTYRFRICLTTPTRACINSPESIKVFVSPNYPDPDMPTGSRKKPPQPIIVQAQVISCSKIEIGWQLPDYELDDYDGDAGYYDGDRNSDRPEVEQVDDYPFHSRHNFRDSLGHYPRFEKSRGVESFYVHYAPYQEPEKIQTLKAEEGDSRSVVISNLKPSTAYSFKMQSVLHDGMESDYSNSIVKETTDCYNTQRQPFEGPPDEVGDYDPYSFQSRPVRPSGGRSFNEFASQSLYVVGGVLFVVVVAALVIAMVVCLYKRRSKEGDKSHQMNQTLMHCYQTAQHQANGHSTTMGSSHLPSCNGHCTMARTLGTNSLQGVEYCRPMELDDSRILANQMQPCQNGKKPPPDLDLPPPPPLPPFQNSAYRGDASHGEDALLYDQLSDPDESRLARNSSAIQQAPFQNGGIYHPLSQRNSPASTACTAGVQTAAPRCPSDAQGNAYWVLENFSRTPSEGSGSYYVTNVPGGLQSQPLLALQEHQMTHHHHQNHHHQQLQQQQQQQQQQPANTHQIPGCYPPAHSDNTGSSSSSSSSSSMSSDVKGGRRQVARQSPNANLTFEPQMYRLTRDGDAGNGFALT